MNASEPNIFPNNEWEWHTLERDLTHWIRTSGYRLNQTEQVPFRRVGFYTLTSGVTSGKLPKVPQKSTRIVISILSGLYSSAVSTRMLRKSVFSQVLEMNSPLGDTARQILINARNNQIMQQNFKPIDFPSPNNEFELNNTESIFNDPFDTSNTRQIMDHKSDFYNDSHSDTNELNDQKEKFRSWEDIRRNN